MGETMRATRKKITLLISTAFVAGILLTGCGDGASDDSAGVSTQANEPAAGTALDQGQAKAEAEGKDTTAQAPDLKVEQRAIIYRGSLSVRVKDVNAAAGQTTGIATTAGGFVGGDNRTSGSGTDTATMELRVPAAKFGAVVDQLSKLGTEEQRQISTEDVTEATIDLDARITVQQARVDSGRKLLSQAKSLEDLVMLEREVATRESDLASLQAKKRNLADLTALSTITVTLLDPSAAAPSDPDDDPPGFVAGLSGGWDALLASLKVLLTVLGALLPWLIALGLPIWAVFWALRRFRRTPALVATEPGEPNPPSGSGSS
jgi:Domain of unknown function (DUF4349)